jgi:ribosome-associated translation inhibitor RaiA
MRLIPVQITSRNIPVATPLRAYISEKLGSVTRSGSDVLGIAMALRGDPEARSGRYTASSLLFLAGRRIYCSASAPTLIGAIDKLGLELARLAHERKRRPSVVPEPDPVPSATISDLLGSIDSRVGEILVPPPACRLAERSPTRHHALPRVHRVAVPVACG